jgi:hypothetical protein
MKTARNSLPILLLAAILLSSCVGQAPEPANPTVDVNAIMTQSVGTVMAQFFQTQTAMYTPPTPTPLDTPTPIPSSTALPLPSPSATTYVVYSTAIVYPSATPTGTYYTPTVNPSTLAYGCNNLGYLRDETIPTGTVMKPEETFTKTWKVANTGTCDWTLGYRVVFVSGADMGALPSRPRNVIPAGKWTQLDVQLTAPKKAGTYVAYFQLTDGQGHGFGPLLGVSIVVKGSYP